MFRFNNEGRKDRDEINIFDAKSIDEFIERLRERFGKTFEEEIKKQLDRLKIQYKRDEQNAINTGLTAHAEEKAKEWICPRIPQWVNSDMLTVLGFLSSFIIAAGFVLGFANRWYLILVVVGLILNWFGDSFDGSLARYRHKTRPNYGYYIDHITDGLTVTVLGLGLGLSGFIRVEIALAFIIMYLMLMMHVELVTYVENEFKYSFGLFGPTEFRIIGILLAVVMFFIPVKYFDIWGYTLTQYDLFATFAVVVMFIILISSIVSKGVELDKIDRAKWKKE
ncbi:MAG TPA: CDP-alcohol phosphatidyltransferase family protein [Candidatus Dojkabacteria bacterium]|nr:CDP-alcohol phosphatidyltransferase family protein [Candidatus Dojkabacteria bacterium]